MSNGQSMVHLLSFSNFIIILASFAADHLLTNLVKITLHFYLVCLVTDEKRRRFVGILMQGDGACHVVTYPTTCCIALESTVR